jgi:hypothetical protein
VDQLLSRNLKIWSSQLGNICKAYFNFHMNHTSGSYFLINAKYPVLILTYFTIWSTVVTACTTCFNIKSLCFCHECICMFHVVLWMNGTYFLNTINQAVFVLQLLWFLWNRNQIFKCVHIIAKSDCWLCHVCLSVRPSVQMKQRGSQWIDFHEIWYLRILGLKEHWVGMLVSCYLQ